jgi:outer membrane protein TolC
MGSGHDLRARGAAPRGVSSWPRGLAVPPVGAALAAGLVLAAGLAAAALATQPVVGIPGPAGATSEMLSVDACVAAALAGNADLVRERVRRRELEGQGWQAVSTALPSVDVSGNWSRSRDPSFLLDNSFGGGESLPDSIFFFPSPDDLTAQSFWRSQAAADWEINPFRIYNAVKGIRIKLDQYEEDLQATTQSVIEQTMATYYEVMAQRERLDAIESEIEARQEFLEITRKRYSLGLATELDTLQAAVSHANLLPEARRARTAISNSASFLNILMGRDAVEPITVDGDVPTESDPIDAEVAIEHAMNRPELRSLEYEIEVQKKRRGLERSETMPFLSMGGAVGFVSRDLDTHGDYDYWNASVSLVWPIFNGFYTRGRVQEVDGVIAGVETTLEESRRLARLQVSTSLQDLFAAREVLAAAELNAEAAQRALEQVTARYDRGKAEYLQVLNAQSDRIDARSNLIRARYEVLIQTAALKRSVGVDPRIPLSELAAQEDAR